MYTAYLQAANTLLKSLSLLHRENPLVIEGDFDFEVQWRNSGRTLAEVPKFAWVLTVSACFAHLRSVASGPLRSLVVLVPSMLMCLSILSFSHLRPLVTAGQTTLK